EYQLELDEQAFRKCMEEQAREQAKIDVEQEKLDKERREEQEYEEKNVWYILYHNTGSILGSG
ncbi:hypothetical protein Tco_0248556, partial [Tanacetum coccineum]